ncbi:hypothetical protein RK21_01660 [Pseudomonas plecoglossicida]|nr:hypothetical protein RK21_01660 [Pseudomonas plecoglossicida]
MGAGSPAKQAMRWMAPAGPVFAGAPAPTGMAHSFSWWGPSGSGHAREAGDAVEGTGWAGVRGRARSHRYGAFLQLVGSLWERVYPRSRRCGGWHRLRRCSRARPLPQVWRIPSAGGVPVGAGSPAKQAMRWMAPAAPVFAGAPAPTGMEHFFSWWGPCGSGFTREAGDAVDGTGCAGVRG